MKKEGTETSNKPPTSLSGINTTFRGNKFTWELNSSSQLTLNGIVELFSCTKGTPKISIMAVANGTLKPFEERAPIIIFEGGLALGRTVFDPNRIVSVRQIKKFGVSGIIFNYQEGTQSPEISIGPTIETAQSLIALSKSNTKMKDLLTVFPTIIETAKKLPLVRAQETQQRQAHQQQLQAEQDAAMESSRMNKLKKLVKVSEKLKISQMAQILNMDEAKLYDRIVDWAADFGFTIDEDVVKFSGGRKDDFIASMNNAFADWNKKTETKDGKLE